MDNLKLRKIYHKLFNQLNNICMISGIFRVELENIKSSPPSKKELKEKLNGWIKALKNIEKNVLSISDKLQSLSKITKFRSNSA